MRIALGIEYNGHGYCGWQAQRHQANTVQAAVETALSTIAAQSVTVVCAGRTDSGVHATGQVVHFDIPLELHQQRPLKAWLRGANTLLPSGLSVLWVKAVPQSFHARFSAQARSYRYILYNAASRPGLFANLLSWWYRPLDVDQMQKALPYLQGEQDFTSIRAKDCQAASPIRCIQALSIKQHGPFITLDVTANAFLKHMVRNIVGLLLSVGQGDQPAHWVAAALKAKSRCAAGITAPPQGLSLVHVCYPEEFQLPKPLGVSELSQLPFLSAAQTVGVSLERPSSQ